MGWKDRVQAWKDPRGHAEEKKKRKQRGRDVVLSIPRLEARDEIPSCFDTFTVV